MLIWVSVSWTPRSHRKVLLVSSRSHATGNSSRGASSWRPFIARALIVNAVSSPQGQKEKLGKFGSSGHSRQKANAHRPSDVLSFRASCAPNPAYDVRRELMDGIPEGAGGEGEGVIPNCRQELSRALHRGSGTEISCKAEIPQTPGPSRRRSSGGVSQRGAEVFPSCSLFLLLLLPACSALLTGLCNAPLPAPRTRREPVGQQKNILLEKAVCLTLPASLPGLTPNTAQAASLPLSWGKRSGERARLSLGTVQCAAQLSSLLLHWPTNPNPPK